MATHLAGSALHGAVEPAPDDDKAVVVSGLGKSFGTVAALRDVSFEVGRGEVVAILGPNGAGKTTLVNILSTLTRPDRGHASIAGFDVVSDAASVRHSIMLTGQHVALDEMLTARENLVLFGRLRDLPWSSARARADELIRKFDLVDAANRPVGTYSGGMRRRVDIACGLVVPPEVVFLDEPTTGLDPWSRQTIWDLVADFKSQGIATLLTTQYLEEADELSDRIIVVDHGVIVAEGTADELKERTGGSYCEIVPRDVNDLPALMDALGPLLPAHNRDALADDADRIAIPAPDGPKTLVDALSRISTADIELTDIALRRPSLDDVFLTLTNLPPGPEVGEAPEEPVRPLLQRLPSGATTRRVLSPVLAGLLVGGVAAVVAAGSHDGSRPAQSDTVFASAHSGACLTWPKDAPEQPSIVGCEDDHLFEVATVDNPDPSCQPAVQRYLGDRFDPNSKFTITALRAGKADAKPLCGLELLGTDGQPIAFKGQVAQQDQSKVWPAGTCLGIVADTNQPTDIPVDCTAPHALEVTGAVNLGKRFSGPPPSRDEQDAYLTEACTQAADAYLAPTPLSDTDLTLHYNTVAPASWSAGSRQVSCDIGAPLKDDEGWAKLTGSAKGKQWDASEASAPTTTETTSPDTSDASAATSAPVAEISPTATPSPSTTAAIPSHATATPLPPEPHDQGRVVEIPGVAPVTLPPGPGPRLPGPAQPPPP